MPLTRARQTYPSRLLDDDDDENDNNNKRVFILKKSTRTDQSRSTRLPSLAPSCGSCSSVSGIEAGVRALSSRKKSLQRTVSSPASLDGVVVAWSASYKRSTSSSKTRPSANSSSPSSSLDASQTSTNTFKGVRRRKSSSVTRPDSANGDGEERRPFSGRFGGCSNQVEVLDKRDDSNKENVAPLRAVGQPVLAVETQDFENGTVARRTRGRMSITRMQRTSSSASSITSLVASETPTTPSRVSTRSSRRQSARRENGELTSCIRTDLQLAESTPRHSEDTARTPSLRYRSTTSATVTPSPSSRKRPRPSLDAFEQASEAGDPDFRTPGTPMSRLRLDTCSIVSVDDDRASYISSSQASSTVSGAPSSIFDEASSARDGSIGVSDALSRATSPCDRDMDATILAADEIKADTAVIDDAAVALQGYSNVYAHARALLRYDSGASFNDAATQISPARDAEIVGRDLERRALGVFLSKRFGAGISRSSDQDITAIDDLLDGNTDSGSLYICGLPGTGKTALVRSVVSSMLSQTDLDRWKFPRVAFVNCMSLQHPRQVFVSVMEALGETIKGASESHIEAEAERRMDKLLRHGNDTMSSKILIILDEMDHLLHSRAHQNVLYRLFSWASGQGEDSNKSSSCALIGIANSLDLTERFVPLLASKGVPPAVLHFRPFESKEIVEVLQSRLRDLKSRYDGEDEDDNLARQQAAVLSTAPPLFTPAALELVARKISAATGDLRKALDAARLAVEAVEGEQRRQALTNCTVTGTGTNTEASRLLSHLTPSSAPKVTPQHILKVLTAVLGSPHLPKLRQLGLQAKLILAAVFIAHQRAAEGMPVLGSKGNQRSSSSTGGVRLADIESTYTAMLRNDGGFTPLESSEVNEIFELLEVQGFLSLSGEVPEQGQTNKTDVPSLAATTVSGSGVSPGGKRAAKKQLLASGRIVRALVPLTDLHKGITTVTSASTKVQPPRSLSASSVDADTELVAPSQAVADSIKRMVYAEEERIRKSRGWEQVAKQRQTVRNEELGGGRLRNSNSVFA